MQSKVIGKIFFWCVVLGIHIFLCHKIISSYMEYQKTLEELETPVEMAKVFMDSEYDFWWEHIDKVMLGRRDPRSGLDIYEIWADIVPDIDTTYYRYDDGKMAGYLYRAVSPEANSLNVSFSLKSGSGIFGESGAYGEDKNGPLKYYSISLIEENGEYVVDGGDMKKEFEEHTGMTLEEIVEIVEKSRQGFEDIMYGMKAHEIKRNKLFCIGKLAVLHILLIAFVLYMNWDAVKRGIRRLRKEGKQDGKDSLKE